jgi:hypothetical protein
VEQPRKGARRTKINTVITMIQRFR